MHSQSRRRARSIRAVRLMLAAAIAAMAGGCQAVNGVFASLFGAPPSFPVVSPLPAPAVLANRIVVLKGRRMLQLEHNGAVFATYPIALGPHPDGPKEAEGDGRTPQGEYFIDWKTTDTPYTGELHISYPDGQDVARAAALRVNPGGAIFIHGMPRDYGPYDPPKWYRDWTEGCIAVGNAAIAKILRAVPLGTPIDILP
jgi:lipoprotein-anchoring transpeptidase ErfK/SrfK